MPELRKLITVIYVSFYLSTIDKICQRFQSRIKLATFFNKQFREVLVLVFKSQMTVFNDFS